MYFIFFEPITAPSPPRPRLRMLPSGSFSRRYWRLPSHFTCRADGYYSNFVPVIFEDRFHFLIIPFAD